MTCYAPTSCNFTDCNNVLSLNYIYSFQQVVDNYTSPKYSYPCCGVPPGNADSTCPNAQGANTDTMLTYTIWFETSQGCLCHSKYSDSGKICSGLQDMDFCLGDVCRATNYLNFHCMTVDPSLYTSGNLPLVTDFSRFATKVSDDQSRQWNVYRFKMDFLTFPLTEGTLYDFKKLFLDNIPSYFLATAVNSQFVYQCNLNFYNCLLNYFCCTNGTSSNISTTICQNSNITTSCADSNYCPNMTGYCNTESTFNTFPCLNYYQNSYNTSDVLGTESTYILQNQCRAYVDSDNNISSDMPEVCGCFLPDEAYRAYWNSISNNNPILEAAFNDKQCETPYCANTTALQPELNHTCKNLNIVTCLQEINVGSANSSVINASQDCYASTFENTGSLVTTGTSTPSPSPSTSTSTSTSIFSSSTLLLIGGGVVFLVILIFLLVK